MDRLSNWAWWLVAGGVVLSPVVAFLLALLVEICMGIVKDGGTPALLVLLSACLVSLCCRKLLMRPQTDQG